MREVYHFSRKNREQTGYDVTLVAATSVTGVLDAGTGGGSDTGEDSVTDGEALATGTLDVLSVLGSVGTTVGSTTGVVEGSPVDSVDVVAGG